MSPFISCIVRDIDNKTVGNPGLIFGNVHNNKKKDRIAAGTFLPEDVYTLAGLEKTGKGGEYASVSCGWRKGQKK
jgi:hypothetical protein